MACSSCSVSEIQVGDQNSGPQGRHNKNTANPAPTVGARIVGLFSNPVLATKGGTTSQQAGTSFQFCGHVPRSGTRPTASYADCLTRETCKKRLVLVKEKQTTTQYWDWFRHESSMMSMRKRLRVLSFLPSICAREVFTHIWDLIEVDYASGMSSMSSARA